MNAANIYSTYIYNIKHIYICVCEYQKSWSTRWPTQRVQRHVKYLWTSSNLLPPATFYLLSNMSKVFRGCIAFFKRPNVKTLKHMPPPKKRCLTTPLCPAHPCTISKPDGAISQRSVFSQALMAALKVISSAWTECLGVPKTFNKHIAYCGLLWHRLQPLV